MNLCERFRCKQSNFCNNITYFPNCNYINCFSSIQYKMFAVGLQNGRRHLFSLLCNLHYLAPFCACAAIGYLIRRNSFFFFFLCEKSFSIDLVRRVEIIIPTLKNCLVIDERRNGIVCVLRRIPSRNTMSSRGDFRSGQLSPRSRLV